MFCPSLLRIIGNHESTSFSTTQTKRNLDEVRRLGGYDHLIADGKDPEFERSPRVAWSIASGV